MTLSHAKLSSMIKRATIKDIAKEAGVSHPLVSTVLNGRKNSIKCSDETRRRILKIAKRRDYKPSISARSLRRQKSYLIGILFSSVNYSIMSDFFHGFQKQLSKQGYSPVIFVHNSPEEEYEYLQRCIEREVDGLIVNSAVTNEGTPNKETIAKLSAKIPIVEIFGCEVDGVASLTLDYYSGALNATKYLIKEGHEKIALYTHNRVHMHENVPGLFFNAARYQQGYLQAIKEAGLPEILVTHSISDDLSTEGYCFDGAYQSAGTILEHPEKPTAILCMDREEVDGIMFHLGQNDDYKNRKVHIISMLTSSYSRIGQCKISTLALPIFTMGMEAANSIFNLINGQESEDCAFAFRIIE